jgi:hypothetical protein
MYALEVVESNAGIHAWLILYLQLIDLAQHDPKVHHLAVLEIGDFLAKISLNFSLYTPQISEMNAICFSCLRAIRASHARPFRPFQIASFSNSSTRPSGHSKWSTIKHDKARKDAATSKQRTILLNDIVKSVECKCIGHSIDKS